MNPGLARPALELVSLLVIALLAEIKVLAWMKDQRDRCVVALPALEFLNLNLVKGCLLEYRWLIWRRLRDGEPVSVEKEAHFAL